MAQQRSRTLIEHLGFHDPDLTSPAHDSLILWIADHIREHVEKGHDPWRDVARQLEWAEAAIQAERNRREEAAQSEKADYERVHKWSYEKPEDFQERAEKQKKRWEQARARCLETAFMDDPIPRAEPPPVGIKTEFEKTLVTGRDFIAGFIDVVAEVDYPGVYAAHIDWNDNGKIKGYTQPPELRFESHREWFYFEAKPKIPSLGELLRQIRTYQEYVPWQGESYGEKRRNHFVIVSPDTRFRAPIESQGIEFWESPTF